MNENDKKEEFLKKEEKEELEGELQIDLYQTEEEFIVQSLLAGVKEEDIDINITNESISIKGKRRKQTPTPDVPKQDYFHQECFWGSFSRSIILPQEIDPEKSQATLKNGILTIRLPKMERKKAKKIKIILE